MAAPIRRADSSVEALLLSKRACEFEFFQAVRLLALIFKERAQIGGDVARTEALRFKATPSLTFPPSAITKIDVPPEPSAAIRLWVAFFGMTGPLGVLPRHYTELVIRLTGRGKKDVPLADFLDIFNHRFLSFFYRAWEKHHFAFQWERQPDARAESAGVTQYLLDLIGLGTRGLENRLAFTDETLLLYSGLIALRPLSAVALQGVLSDYFGTAIRIEQFRGRWLVLDPQARSYLNQTADANRLGYGAVAGDAVWSIQTRFRISIGPLPLATFLTFLPGGRSLRALCDLTTFLTRRAYEFDILLILSARDVPACRLHDEGSDAPRLGLIAWLGGGEIEKDTHDTEFTAGWHYEPTVRAA